METGKWLPVRYSAVMAHLIHAFAFYNAIIFLFKIRFCHLTYGKHYHLFQPQSIFFMNWCILPELNDVFNRDISTHACNVIKRIWELGAGGSHL
jgi:hypothetical protein